MEVNELLEYFDEQDFISAVKTFHEDNILFEGQFPFLDNPNMRRFSNLTTVLRHFGLGKNFHSLSWNIEEQGFMCCFFTLGEHFSTIEEVKKAHRIYFDNI